MPVEKVEIFDILGNIKLLNDDNKKELLTNYINEQYEVLKKELFEEYQNTEQFYK